VTASTSPPQFTAAVLGSGSWGTAFAKVLADAGGQVTLWSRRGEVAAVVRDTHANPEYLPGITLPPRLTATADAAKAMASHGDGVDLVVFAVPSQTLRGNVERWRALLPEHALLVSLAKGVELGTHKRMSEVIIEAAGVDQRRVVVVTGPNLAREIALEQPAATVAAASDREAAAWVQQACTTSYLRPYLNTDVVGCELGGAVKNVIALACGMAAGMGYGDNTQATLITRGLAETSRLGVALGANPLTFAGLAGLGDLVATCTSPLSRNRTLGERLGRGDSLEHAIIATKQTAEGVKSCLSILELGSASGVEMPITEQVVRVCHEGLPPAVALKHLMQREPKHE
jgi:glycerol-3-phosphate dehydrogenase (NAD(P)+)